MKLDWERVGVVTATLKVQELAALVAGARLAAAALAAQSPEKAGELERVLSGFDRALARLHRVGATDQSRLTSVQRPAVSMAPDQGKEFINE